MKIPTLTENPPYSINSEENHTVRLEFLQSKFFKYLFWVAIISCFINSVIGIRAFGIVWFPLRVILLMVFPFLLPNISHKKKGIRRFASRLLILMLIYGIASLIWSPDPSIGFRAAEVILMGFMLFLLITHQAIDRAVLSQIMIIWSIMIIGTSLLGYYEIVRGEYLYPFDSDDAAAGGDIIETVLTSVGWLCPRIFWPNRNDFAFINSISALVLFGWAFEARGFYRILALIATVLAISMVMYSFSRAAIFGLLIGLLFFVFIFIVKMNAFYRNVSILLLIILSIFLFYNGQELLKSSMTINAVITKTETGDYDVRSRYLDIALFQGTIGSFGFGRGLGASTEIIEGGSYHNYLLEFLAELGLWCFLLYLILMKKICFQLWNAIRKGRNIFWSCGLLASCIAFPLLCTGPAGIPASPYWLWLSFLVAYTEYDLING